MFVGGSPRVARWVAATGCLLVGLGACGGGGGGGGSGTTTQGFNTAEFQFNYGLGNINALAVYGGGFSGAGQTIAIIDTGIDVDHPDLIANIAAASTDIVSGDPTFLNDVDGHGTQVAGVAAAARNGFGGHGVAFNAQILAIRADAAAICIDTSCGFDDADLAAAVDFAVAQGADVINMSLGGAAPSSAGLQTAIQNAVAAGVIFAIAAGNQAGVDPLNPAALASDPAVNGQIIAVGAVDQNNVIADFSNRAGTAQNFFLVAPGVAILTTTIGGGFASANGTSFAAPHVAGGIALLLERFPNLTAQNAVNILLTTATDLGAVGTDATFGRGLLNLAAALAPLGTLTLSLGDASGGGGGEGGGRAQSLSLDDTGLNLGPAFGDGLARQPLLRSAIALDGFERAYRVDLTGRIGAANPAPDVAGILFDRAARRSACLDLVPDGSLALALTVMMPGADDGAGAAGPSDAGPDDPSVTLTGSRAPGLQLALSHDASPLARLGPLSSSVPTRHLSPGASATPFADMVAGGTTVILDQAFTGGTRLRLGAAAARKSFDDAYGERWRATAVAELAHEFAGGVGLATRMGVLHEEESFLGSVSAGAFAASDDARSAYFGITARAPLAAAWSLVARASAGVTRVDGGGLALIDDFRP